MFTRLTVDCRAVRFAVCIGVLILVSGCASASLDVSTGDQTSLIKGFVSPFIDCSVYPQPPYGGSVDWAQLDEGTRALTVDAGRVSVIVRCDMNLPYSTTAFTLFEFDAEADHTYAVSRRFREDRCVELVDTADETMVGCELIRYGSYLNLSTGRETALLVGSWNPQRNFARCRLGVTDYPGARIEWMQLDAGEVSTDVRCDIEGFFSNKDAVADFSFTALADHEYAFRIDGEDCIHLIDVTDDERSIACQPYERVGVMDMFTQ
ncbi:MAG: hypothetical protein QNI99_15930 [Woeseiaceae bacterium]|nr:hypothetical protein [Woeseiaceae bacterium]